MASEERGVFKSTDGGESYETINNGTHVDFHDLWIDPNDPAHLVPIKVNNRLANLMSMAERGDGRPGNNMPVIFDILVEELQGYTTRLSEIWATDLAAVNAILSRLNLPAIDPNCARPEGCLVM